MKSIFLLVLSLAAFTGCHPRCMVRHTVQTADAPAAIGPYSQAVKAGRMLFVSGQLPIDPATKQFVPGAITEQTRQVLENCKAVLAASGMTPANVVSSTVYLKNLNDFAKMNEVYASYFAADPPARATVEVARLPKDALVEISMIAVK